MKRVGAVFAALALATMASASGCRSSSDKAPTEPPSAPTDAAESDATNPGKADAKSPFQAAPKPGARPFDCQVKPDTACCEALTPSCNECRAKAARALDAWKSFCGRATLRPAECNEKLPSVACCPEATTECNFCRSQAINKLLERRAKCGETPTP